MDPTTAGRILQGREQMQAAAVKSAGMVTAGVQVDAPQHVTMISATLNEGAEGLSLIMERVRQLAQNLRTAADQVYGECEGGPDMPGEAPGPGSAGHLSSQMRELDRWVCQAELEANRLCGAS